MKSNQLNFAEICVRARRRLIQMHFEANAGHLGGNLSCLDLLLTLYHCSMDAQDLLVLSKGHSAGALYTTLWSLDLLTDEDLQTFHKDDTRLAGHPPAKGIDGVIFGTGSLGHGLSLSTGLAKGLQIQGKSDHVYCVCSDGEWQEGSTWEALIFAAHQKLNNLTVLIDANGLQGFGGTDDVASMQDLQDKIAAFDVELDVIDGHDHAALEASINRPVSDRARFIVCKTIKGKGIEDYEGKMMSHYLPISREQYDTAMSALK